MAPLLDVDKGLRYLGHWYNCTSKWHLLLYMVGNLLCLFSSMQMMAVVFLGLEPVTVHCKLPEGKTPSDSIPPDEYNKDVLDKCSHYQNFSKETNITVEGCPLGWYYSDEVYSIVHEWDAICDNAILVGTSQIIYVLGSMVGAFVMSPIMDKWGRKRVALCSVMLVSILGFCNGWVKHYWLFCLFRFVLGFFQSGMGMAGFIYLCELFPTTDRTVACMLSGCFWSFGMFALDLFAYLVPRWNHLLFTISLPGLLAFPLFWLIPESVPYLVAHGRLREAKEILQAAAKMNGVKLPPEYDLSPEDEKLLKADAVDGKRPRVLRRQSSVANAVHLARQSSVGKAVRRMSRAPLPPDGAVHNYTWKDIFKSKRLLAFSLIVAYLWCTSALVYYGLSLNIGSLAGDTYLNFFLSGLVEVPAALISAVVLNIVGRRVPLIIFYLIAGIPLLATIFIPPTTGNGTNLQPLIITLAMIGKFGISACFGSVFLYAPELFPTSIRGVGLGIASVGSRLGNLIAPYTPLVMDVIPWLPNTVFGVMAIIGAILCFFLPETLGRPLPQTIHEVEQWSRTLTPEEKRKFKESKEADKEFEKNMKLQALMEEETPEA